MFASYRNRAKDKGRVVEITEGHVVVICGRRRFSYFGVPELGLRIGDEVELPLPCRWWSMKVAWSPFDEPSEFDIDD